MLSANDLRSGTAGGAGLDYERFAALVKRGQDYDVGDLAALLRRDQKPDIASMITGVLENYRFLAELTEPERILAKDEARRNRKEAETLIEILRA
jgi:hypothetical protein